MNPEEIKSQDELIEDLIQRGELVPYGLSPGEELIEYECPECGYDPCRCEP